MLKSISVLSGTLLAGLAIASSASALNEQFLQSGTRCNPVQPADQANLRFNQYGVSNTATAAVASVQCGATLPAGNISQIDVTVYDRHPSSEVCCTILVLDQDGAVQTSAQRCSSGFSSAAKPLPPFSPGAFS